MAVLPVAVHKLPAICSLLAGVCAESLELMLISIVMMGLGWLFVQRTAAYVLILCLRQAQSVYRCCLYPVTSGQLVVVNQ